MNVHGPNGRMAITRLTEGSGLEHIDWPMKCIGNKSHVKRIEMLRVVAHTCCLTKQGPRILFQMDKPKGPQVSVYVQVEHAFTTFNPNQYGPIHTWLSPIIFRVEGCDKQSFDDVNGAFGGKIVK